MPPRKPMHLSRLRAGESHMDLKRLLHWRTRRILKTAPESSRGSNGQVQENFPAVAGPARGQCEARSSGGAVHCAGGGAVRSGKLLGYGGLRTVEGRTVAAFPALGAWRTEPRYVQPGVPSAQTTSLRTGVPPLHGGFCRGQRAQPYRGGGYRRQGPARRLRTRRAGYTAATGQRLCGGCAHGFGSAESAWSQRDGRCFGGAGSSVPRRLHGHRRRAALPPRFCDRDTRSGWRLCSGDQSQSWASVQGGYAAVCAIGQAQQRRAGRPRYSRSARNAARDHHAQYQPGGDPPLSGRRRGGPDHFAQAPAGPARRRAVRALLSLVQIPVSQAAAANYPQPLGHREPLHWVLDVNFGEDRNRARKDNAPENLAILRRLALNILRTHPNPASIRRKIKRAGWDDAFLMATLS